MPGRDGILCVRELVHVFAARQPAQVTMPAVAQFDAALEAKLEYTGRVCTSSANPRASLR